MQKYLLVTITLFFIPFIMWGYDIEIDGIYYNIDVKSKTASVTSGDSSYVGDIIIPSSIDYANQTLPVSSIEKKAFDGCSSLVSVDIPNSVTSIGMGAFKGCSSLVSVDISNSVTSIELMVFSGCSSLVSVDIPNSVISIGGGAFAGCSNLVSVDIPNSVTSIGGEAFAGCSNLVSVGIPNSVTSIGLDAFQGCSSLVYVDIPNSVTSELNAFRDCTSLVSVSIPNSIPAITGFSGCSSLTSINIPSSVTTIGSEAFLNCTSLSSIDIPNSVTYIGESAFFNCIGLTSIRIPSSVTQIGFFAFDGCTGLKYLELEDGELDLKLDYSGLSGSKYKEYVSFMDCPIENLYLGRNLKYADSREQSPFYYNTGFIELSIGKYVKDIYYCMRPGINEDLTIINSYAIIPPKTYQFSTNQYATVIVNVPKGSLEDYSSAQYWSNFWNLQETLPGPEIKPKQIVLNLESAELNIGETIQLEATVLPEDTTDKALSWNSSDPNVATVSDNGLVTAIAEGSATISATCGEVSATCVITVSKSFVEAEQIVLNLESAELNIGETVQLEATVLPEVTTDKTLSWNSSDPNVATVSDNGLVTAISVGIAIITASCGEVSTQCQINVLEDAGVESLLANPESNISIYSTEGILIKKDCKVEDLKTLNKGIYIIVSGKDRYKVSI